MLKRLYVYVPINKWSIISQITLLCLWLWIIIIFIYAGNHVKLPDIFHIIYASDRVVDLFFKQKYLGYDFFSKQKTL